MFFDILSLVINLKVLFKNTTKYDKKIYREFINFHQKIYGFRYKLYTIVIILLLMFIAICQISFNGYVLALISFIVIVIFFLWRLIHPVSTISKELKSDKIQKEESFTFYFYDKYFKIREEIKLETYTMKYFSIYKVYETKSFFYIYTDKTHAFLINKNCFSIGNSKHFSEFIHKKCKFKYRSKLKNK